ncbi:MAG: hypothetical protein HYT38_02450 [Candidatus Sungbacteria bacterium]|uniref:Uncharacterized protein n=1 Tax=Candidatus Sungiibacteriota bacterium TaxID=2750080 RepID=A0A932DSR5_9BACT|nr:hypothetical protein [Candidatus Sungbacteria bacterium]MBI2466182.1 hypothetical protein [Candidatus Sungbacteria bacterium]
MFALFRIGLSVLVAAVAAIPIWVYLAARHFLSPEGFWQEFFLLGIGLWLLWGAQVFFAIAGLFVLMIIWILCEKEGVL